MPRASTRAQVLLLEGQLLFRSESFERLTLAAEAACQLMYPLEWSNVYVPIVPTALVDYLDSPTPFIMGLNARIAWDPVTAPDVTIVDLDRSAVNVPASSPLPPLPPPLAADLRGRLQGLAGAAAKGSAGEWAANCDCIAQHAFLAFVAGILNGLEECSTVDAAGVRRLDAARWAALHGEPEPASVASADGREDGERGFFARFADTIAFDQHLQRLVPGAGGDQPQLRRHLANLERYWNPILTEDQLAADATLVTLVESGSRHRRPDHLNEAFPAVARPICLLEMDASLFVAGDAGTRGYPSGAAEDTAVPSPGPGRRAPVPRLQASPVGKRPGRPGSSGRQDNLETLNELMKLGLRGKKAGEEDRRQQQKKDQRLLELLRQVQDEHHHDIVTALGAILAGHDGAWEVSAAVYAACEGLLKRTLRFARDTADHALVLSVLQCAALIYRQPAVPADAEAADADPPQPGGTLLPGDHAKRQLLAEFRGDLHLWRPETWRRCVAAAAASAEPAAPLPQVLQGAARLMADLGLTADSIAGVAQAILSGERGPLEDHDLVAGLRGVAAWAKRDAGPAWVRGGEWPEKWEANVFDVRPLAAFGLPAAMGAGKPVVAMATRGALVAWATPRGAHVTDAASAGRDPDGRDPVGGPAAQVLSMPSAHRCGACELSADGDALFLGGEAGAEVWDCRTGRRTSKLVAEGGDADGPMASITRLRTNANDVLFAGSAAGAVALWDCRLSNPKPLARLAAFHSAASAASAAVTGIALGAYYAAFASEGSSTALVFDTRKLHRPLRRLAGHRDGLAGLALDDTAPGGPRVATASFDWTARVRAVGGGGGAGDGAGAVLAGHDAPVTAVALRGAGAVTGAMDGGVRAWLPEAGVGGWAPAGGGHLHRRAVQAAYAVGDGRFLTGAQDNEWVMWGHAGGTGAEGGGEGRPPRLAALDRRHSPAVLASSAFNAATGTLFAGTAGGAVLAWQLDGVEDEG